MANDRLYLVCNKCGATKTFFKFWCSEDASRLIPEGTEEFINHHLFSFDCEPTRHGNSLEKDPGFVIANEGTVDEVVAAVKKSTEKTASVPK